MASAAQVEAPSVQAASKAAAIGPVVGRQPKSTSVTGVLSLDSIKSTRRWGRKEEDNCKTPEGGKEVCLRKCRLRGAKRSLDEVSLDTNRFPILADNRVML